MNFALIIIGGNFGYESRGRRIDRVSSLKNIRKRDCNMIISLGYRVKSAIATRFRRWATERLKEYIVKGFTMDDERLKKLGGGNYWKELLVFGNNQVGNYNLELQLSRLRLPTSTYSLAFDFDFILKLRLIFV